MSHSSYGLSFLYGFFSDPDQNLLLVGLFLFSEFDHFCLKICIVESVSGKLATVFFNLLKLFFVIVLFGASCQDGEGTQQTSR